METVFDHGPTREELEELFGEPISRKGYVARDSETENGRLYRLYMLRGKPVEAAVFLDRIADPEYRFNVALIDVQ